MKNSKEIIFQVVIHLLVFSIYSFNKNHPDIEMYKIVFFLNYAVAAFIISYIFLPQFLYRKRYFLFFILILLVIAGVIFVEEAILEKIYFPDTRGTNFPGISYSLLDVLPEITMLVGAKLAWDTLVKQQEVEELKAIAEESELQFLKSQINPHFLFNNLNNLYSYTIEHSPKAPTIILELSSVLRYMLYECRERFVPLTKEIEQLKNFTQLYELQIEERGEVKFRTAGIKPGYQIAPLILIVFIENAFKHSQASQSENIQIDILVELSNGGQLDFYCKNNFQPLANTENLAKGIGLNNVKKRLQLLYPEAHDLKISDAENQFEVRLSLKLNPTII